MQITEKTITIVDGHQVNYSSSDKTTINTFENLIKGFKTTAAGTEFVDKFDLLLANITKLKNLDPNYNE